MEIKKLPCLWKYDHDDQSTWPYLDFIATGSGENRAIVRWIKNPLFKFGHLIKGYQDAAIEGIKSKIKERNQQEHSDGNA